MPASKPRILVLGDLIIDVHHFAANGGTSTEAAVLLGLHQKSKLSWGGAGLVVRNLLALGQAVTFVSVLGNDEYGRKADTFEHARLKKVFFKENRSTLVKERFLIDNVKVLRQNRGDSKPISKGTAAAILQFVKKNIKRFDMVLVSDYRHGLLTKALAKGILGETARSDKKFFIDSQVVRGESNHLWYRGASLFCLNEKEALSIDPSFDPSSLEASLPRLSGALATPNLIVKLGKRGSAALLEGSYFETPAEKVHAVDPVGAGDAFFAALASRPPLSARAIEFANRWAGLATTIRGTEPPTRAMLKKN